VRMELGRMFTRNVPRLILSVARSVAERLGLRFATRVSCSIRNGLSHSQNISFRLGVTRAACFSRNPRHLKRLFSAHRAESAIRPAFFQPDS
jgi:hypothetical protein